MSAIVTAVFKATVGLVVNKGRNVMADKLKEGDVADQKVREMIIGDMEDVKSKLNALSRKDLGAAVDSLETGLRFLNNAVHAMYNDNPSWEGAKEPEGDKEDGFHGLTLPSASYSETTVILDAGTKNVQLTESVNEVAKSTLSAAKERFKLAREKATDACNNEALSTFDRITAIRYRVMAAMLESAAETVGTAGDLKITLKSALPECEQCLQKLHSLPAVQKSFKVELEKGRLNVRSRFGKEERREIISTVCHVNRAIYDATLTVYGGDVHVWVWPYVDTGEDKVDPLRDGRIRNVVRKVNMEQCCVTPWSFGQEGEEEHKLKRPYGIATNTKGQFLVADNGDKTVKVFDSKGKFYFSFYPQTDDADTKLMFIYDIATGDVDDKICLLVELNKDGVEKWEVQVFNETRDLQHKFPVKRGKWDWGRVVLSSSKVLVLVDDVVDVHEREGKFVCSFAKGDFKIATDITATCDGHVMIVGPGESSHFTVEGQQLANFDINIEGNLYYCIACHPKGEHVVVAGRERDTRHLTLAIYTVTGLFIRRIHLDEELDIIGGGITVTMEGHIAVTFTDRHYNGKVIVV